MSTPMSGLRQDDHFVCAFDRRGRLVSLTTPGGATTQFECDGDRRVVRITDANGRVHEVAWMLDGTLVEIIDPKTNECSFSFERRLTPEQRRALSPPESLIYVERTGPVTTFTYSARRPQSDRKSVV